jgi:hypothetical protein
MMPYLLYVADDCGPVDDPESTAELLGEFADYEQAMDACDTDVLAELEANAGWRMHSVHLIVGPGLEGERTEHPVIASVGVDPDRSEPPTDDDLTETRAWLTWVRTAE